MVLITPRMSSTFPRVLFCKSNGFPFVRPLALKSDRLDLPPLQTSQPRSSSVPWANIWDRLRSATRRISLSTQSCRFSSSNSSSSRNSSNRTANRMRHPMWTMSAPLQRCRVNSHSVSLFIPIRFFHPTPITRSLGVSRG